jgi:hypothetical protein
VKLTPEFDLHNPTSPPIRAIFLGAQVAKVSLVSPSLQSTFLISRSGRRCIFFPSWSSTCNGGVLIIVAGSFVERGNLILVLFGSRCSGPTRNISPTVLVVGRFPLSVFRTQLAPQCTGVATSLGDLLLAGDDHVVHSPASERHGYTVICRGKRGERPPSPPCVYVLRTLLRFLFIWGPGLLEALASLVSYPVVSASQV